MPSWLMQSTYPAGLAIGPSVTRYQSPMGIVYPDSDLEAPRIFTARNSYTLSNLYIQVSQNNLTGSSTVSSRKNSAAGAQSVSVGAGATGAFTDATNSDSLVDTSTFDNGVVTGAGTGKTITILIISYILSTTALNVPIEGGYGGPSVGFGVTRYFAMAGYWEVPATTESDVAFVFRTTATITHFTVIVRANTCNGASTSRTRKNAGNGNQSVSIAATTTGTFTDAANSDSVVSGDSFNHQFVIGGSSGAIAANSIYSELDSLAKPLISSYEPGIGQNAALTQYSALEGFPQQVAAETYMSVTARASYFLRNGFVRVLTNTVNGTSTETLRKNAAASSLAISITASTTGTFEDTVNVVSVISTDTINWQLVTGGATGAMTMTIVSCELVQYILPTRVSYYPHILAH